MTTPSDAVVPLPERSNVRLSLTDLGVLADTAARNGTRGSFIELALQWAAKANDEINRLRDALATKEAQAEAVAELNRQLLATLAAKEVEIAALRNALERITELDPSVDSDEGHNEWGEADCFAQAQQIARTALASRADGKGG